METRNDLYAALRVLHVDHGGGRHIQPNKPAVCIAGFGWYLNAGEMSLTLSVSEDPCDVKAYGLEP
jgi:hypothetical protein